MSIWVYILFAALIIQSGIFAGVVAKLEKEKSTLKHLAETDVLTDCWNRRVYEADVDAYTDSHLSDEFSCAIIDVNDLKQINDDMGHSAGDEILRKTAECLNECFGQYGKVYRIGGDEFAVIFSARESLTQEIDENFRRALANTKYEMSVSVGYASKDEYPLMTVRELLRKADSNMYKSKKHGGDNDV